MPFAANQNIDFVTMIGGFGKSCHVFHDSDQDFLGPLDANLANFAQDDGAHPAAVSANSGFLGIAPVAPTQIGVLGRMQVDMTQSPEAVCQDSIGSANLPIHMFGYHDAPSRVALSPLVSVHYVLTHMRSKTYDQANQALFDCLPLGSAVRAIPEFVYAALYLQSCVESSCDPDARLHSLANRHLANVIGAVYLLNGIHLGDGTTAVPTFLDPAIRPSFDFDLYLAFADNCLAHQAANTKIVLDVLGQTADIVTFFETVSEYTSLDLSASQADFVAGLITNLNSQESSQYNLNMLQTIAISAAMTGASLISTAAQSEEDAWASADELLHFYPYNASAAWENLVQEAQAWDGE